MNDASPTPPAEDDLPEQLLMRRNKRQQLPRLDGIVKKDGFGAGGRGVSGMNGLQPARLERAFDLQRHGGRGSLPPDPA